MSMKSKLTKSPLDKVLGRIDDLDEVNLGILVQRLARERKLLETVFDVIRDGILVLDEDGLERKRTGSIHSRVGPAEIKQFMETFEETLSYVDDCMICQ